MKTKKADDCFAEMLDTPEAAAFVGLTYWQFVRLRQIGRGPGYHVYRGRCLYRPEDLRAWAEAYRQKEKAPPRGSDAQITNARPAKSPSDNQEPRGACYG